MYRASNVVRPEVLRLAPYNSGLTIAEVLEKYGAQTIAKLGSNENPSGPGPSVVDAVTAAADTLRIYPDPACRLLRRSLSHRHGTSADRIMIGNGSEDLLAIIARGVLGPDDRVITLYPSFPLHEDYATLMGARVERVPVTNDFHIDVPALTRAVASPAKLLIFSNPMNPVGSWLTHGDLDAVIAAVDRDTLIVVDEAYAEYAAGEGYATALGALERCNNPWVVLRTFSKAYGLASLRVGYGVFSDKAICDLIDRVRTPFNVNGLAQIAAIAALDDDGYVASVVELAKVERERVRAGLVRLGYVVSPSKANFLFFRSSRPAGDLADGLLRCGVIVKPWKQPGFEDCIRVSIGMPGENDQFLAALQTLSQ